MGWQLIFISSIWELEQQPGYMLQYMALGSAQSNGALQQSMGLNKVHQSLSKCMSYFLAVMSQDGALQLHVPLIDAAS